jgi:acetoacetate decarboxylase
MGQFTPAQWGAFMPVHNSMPLRGPWHYRDTECVVIEYATDPDAAQKLLPADLELFEPAMAFMVIETNHWTTIGPYSEVYNGILCKWQGELYAYTPGVYVTGEASQVAGREVYGFGKKRAHRIEVIRHNDGQVEAAMDIKPGDGALRALMKTAKNEPADSFAALPLICLKVIPDAEGRAKPSLAQLVSVLFTAVPLVGTDGRAEVFSGPGHMQFGWPSDVDLPIRQITSCKYAHFNAELPYGKILKTYTDKELQTVQAL